LTGLDELEEWDEEAGTLEDEAGTFEDVAAPLLEAAGDEATAPQAARLPDKRISIKAFNEFFMILPS
jgi:hypothetical protein